MRFSVRSLQVCALLAWAAFAATPSRAATSEFKALLDLDNNPSTGCTVATADGPFKGVEQILVTTVDLAQTPPKVISVARQVCTNPITNTFGAPIPITSPFAPPWPVGVNNGTSSSDVVETYLPLANISVGPTIHLAFTADVVGGTGASDATLTTNDQPGGPPIVLTAAPIAAVPTLGELGLVLLALLVAGSAVRLLGKRGTGAAGKSAAVVVVLLLGLGVAWAAGIVPGGGPGQWTDIPPIATDVIGDAPPHADLVAEFAVIENNILFIRFDAFIVGLPKVTSTTPANGATGVAGSAPLTINFNEKVTISATSFKLECPAGTPAAFTVSPAPPGNASSYTLTPTVPLPAGVTCTATVVAAQVHDFEGLQPAANYVFTFTTDGPPAVTSTVPANGATQVSLTAPVTINFSKAVNVTATAFKLECPTGTPKAFTIAPAPPGGATAFTLTPTASLPAGTTCTVTVVASQVADVAAGTHMAANFVFSYTTDTAPTVTSTVPVNGATTVPLTTTITVNFSKAVNVTATAFKLECPTGTPETFAIAPAPPGGAASFTLSPTAKLPAGTTCTVTVVASQVTDVAAGTPLGANFVFSFTTDTAPTVTSTTPANGATQVSPATTITVNFSKAVNVTNTAFKLECPTGTPKAFAIAPAPPGGAASFTLTPSANLPVSTTCTVTVVASQVADVAAGTNLATDDVFSFTTGNPPAVTSTTPANGATAVLASTTVSFTFNHAVNVTATAFKLECPVGTPKAFTLAPAPPGNTTTFTLTPTANLPAGTVCTATAVASQITDASSLHPAADYVITFTIDTPPTVSSTVPANGATAVALNATVSFTFNKAVNITAPGFKLECPTGTPVAFAVAPAAPGGVATFTLTPSVNLPAGTTCTATAVAAQIKDLAGTSLAADVAISFTTDTAPTVSTTAPANGATSVALNATVQFTFNKAVNVTASAFKLECPTGTPVAFALAPAPPGGVATFTLTPSANLPAGTTCTATAVAAQVADLVGTHMAADFVFSFTTDTPPTVTTTVPVGGAVNVPPSTTVTVNFSKTVNVTASAFKLECPVGTPQAFTIAPAPPGGVASFVLTPSAPLPVSTSCTVTVVAAQVADTVAGTHMTADFVFSFTTGTPPVVSSTSPANGAVNVLASTAITVTFNRTVNVTAPGFKLECPAGTPKAFTLSPAPPGGVTTFTLTPSANLPAGITCTVTAVAAQIKDAASGVNMAADFVFTFTVDTAPTVTSTSPVTGATAVPLNSTVSFTFNKAVNVTAPGFKLECPTGTPVAFTLSPAAPGGVTTFTLTPSANLPAGTTCTATAVAAQIKDLAGTNLAADVAVSFTTDTAPTVSTTAPANGATSVALNATVSFTFNKAVNVTASAFKLECPTGTPVAFALAPAPPGGVTTFTLTPSANLPSGTICTATAVAAQIADLAGTHLASDFAFSFTTDTPPAVTTTVPANGAVNLSPSTTITVNFNKTVNVTAPGFKLECPVGTPKAFTLAPAPPGGVASFTLTPSAPLPVSTTCTVTVVAAQIADVSAGTHMAADFVFSFTTGTPPTVASTSPANGATNVLASTAISITFNRTTNVTASAFKLECPVGTPKAFTISPAPPGGVTTFTLTPSAPLPASTTCTVTAVAAQITDAASGVNMAADFVFSFTTDTPPTVTGNTPANGATSVPLNTTVTFTFSKAVNVTASAFKLECPTGTPEAFTLSPSPPGGTTTFTLTPSANLPAGTVCTATAVAAQIADLVGTHLAADFASSFTTDTPPAVTTTVPANGANPVLASTTVTINFNKAVNITASAFTLECPTGTPEAFTIAPSPPGGVASFTLTPSANLPAGAVCTVTVVANQVTDVSAGTQMAANFTFSFTIDTPPTVTSTSPANGAINVPANSAVSVTFNKAVNVTASAFKLECPAGTPQAFSISPSPPGGVVTFTLTPSANLPSDTTCTATVVAAQVADLLGTKMAANFVWTFSTPPLAKDDTYPENLVGNVSINSSVISFSVTANDVFLLPVTITAFDATSANGGTVTMTTSGAGIGQFTYNPAAGYIGADTFTYTISNAHGSTTATVHLTIANIIWFINDNAGAGDGRLSSPFNSLAAFQAINDGVGRHPAANANIFLYDSATAYTGPVTLLNGQKLIGQDATSTLATISGVAPGTSSATLPATGGGSPNKVSITSAGNGVTLGSGNTVWGMSFGNSTGTALTGASVGALKIRDLTINTTGAAVSLANGALDAIINAISAGGGTHGISLTTTTGSFDVEGGGASDPANTTRGRTTAKNGGGTLTLGAGGTIQSATSAGVLLSNATNVTLRNMTIQNNGSGINTGGDGVTASGGTSGLTLDNDLITGHGGNFGLHGTTVSNFTLQHTQISANATTAGVEGVNVWDVRFDDLTGTSSFLNSLFFNSRENIVGMNEGSINSSATLNLTVTNCEFRDTTVGSPGNDGLFVDAVNSANVSVNLSNSNFVRDDANGFQYAGQNSSGGGTITVTNCTFDNNGTDINLAHQGLGKTVTFDINGNTLRQTVGGRNTAISVFLAGSSNATTLLQGKVRSNIVGNNAVPKSGSNFGKGVDLFASGAGTLTATVDSNTVRQIFQDTAFRAISSTHSGQINVTVTNNDFESQPSGMGLDGIDLIVGGNAGDTGTMCAHLTGNVAALGDGSAGGVGIQAEALSGTPTLNLQGYGGAANNTAQIAAFLNTTATTVNPPAAAFALAGTIKAAPSACPTPP